MMRQFYFLLLLLSSLNLSLAAQESYDVIDVRDFRASLSLSLSNQANTQLLLSDYGRLKSSREQGAQAARYLFQAQEYASWLGIYLYHGRLYSYTNKRFLQPDPKSQFPSPYLFVGSDPINQIDLNGYVSRPLVLYFENQYENKLEDASMMDFRAQVSDAYYVPISDFLNDSTIDLEGWNGELFIKGHMSTTPGAEIAVERAKNPSAIKTKSSDVANPMWEKEGEFMVDVDAKKFGKHLRSFAEKRGVNVRSIVAGGCQGQDAAEGIAKGYIGGRTGTGSELYAAGLKHGRNAYVAGKTETGLRGKGGVLPLEKTRFHIKPKGAKTSRSLSKDKQGRKIFSKYRGKIGTEEAFDYKYAEGDELYDLVGGRLPASIADEFEEFHFKY